MITPENYFLIALAFVWIGAAVIQDLRKREVSNWWNFSLIAIALAYRAFVSVRASDYGYFVQGLIGFAIFFGLAYAFYYGRIFAGGDAKLLMGLGAILPFHNLMLENLETFLYFIILLMFCGSIYGLAYSLFLSYRHRLAFRKELLKQLHLSKKIFFISVFLTAVIIFTVLAAKIYLFLWIAAIVLVFPFLYAYAKAIEEACMIKPVEPKNLTIGDWLYKPVKIGKKTIKPNWEGLSERELAILRKSKKKILVKEGIPFTPAFLFALIGLLWLIKSNMLSWLII